LVFNLSPLALSQGRRQGTKENPKLPEEENKGKTASKGEKSKEAGGKDCKSIAELLA
jgi:hypothetical protein